MASLDPEIVKHALQTARDHGFAEVEVAVEGSSFKARLNPAASGSSGRTAPTPESKVPVAAGGELMALKSPLVGFYRSGPNPLAPGRTVAKGEVVAVVNALGIANEVESQVSGEIVEVLVADGQAVEFGQLLAKVKP